MKRRKKSVIVSIAIAMMLAMIAMGGLRALPAKAGETEEKKLEYDLRDGYLRIDDSDTLILESALSSFRCDDDDDLYDLDGDGTADIKITVCYSINYYYHDVMTPVYGGSILGDFVLNSTKEHPLSYNAWDSDAGEYVTRTVTSLVFHFPSEPVKAEYSLSGTNVKFFRRILVNDEFVEEEITKAAPGEEIFLLEDKKTGQYLKAWRTDSFLKDELIQVLGYGDKNEIKNTVAVRRFVMPTQDVTLEPVYEKQQPYTIQLDGPNDFKIGNALLPIDAVDCFIASLRNSELYNYTDYIDLDGDGTDDIYLGPHKNNESLSVCLFSNLTSYTLTAPNDGPYWPVTLSWKEETMFIVNPVSYMFGASLSINNGKLLYHSLKAYEVDEKKGFFDLDQDGSEDLKFDGRSLEYLSTCSVKDSITIPAVPEGVNHPVTFVVNEIPEEKEVFHRVIFILENDGKYYIDYPGNILVDEWYEEGDTLMLYPEEGYEFIKININGSNVPLDDFSRGWRHEINVKDRDIVVRIRFRTKDGIVPKPILEAEAYVVNLSGRVYTIPYEDKAIIKTLMELVSDYGITQQDYTIRLSDTADPDSIPEYIILPEIIELNGHTYDMIQLLLPSSARTHTVSVARGTVDGSSSVVEGEYVRIIPDKRDDGYWVKSWSFVNPDVKIDTDITVYTYGRGVMEFQMGNHDVQVNGNLVKTVPLTIDLSNGSRECNDDAVVCIRDALGYGPEDYPITFDLDGDGTIDVSLNSWTLELRVEKSYSCGESYTLEGGTRGPYYPITFVYNPKNVEPDVTVTPEPTAELTEPTGEPADSSEKKEDSSFHPIYFIIPACVLVCGGATAFLLMRRKKRAAKGEEER